MPSVDPQGAVTCDMVVEFLSANADGDPTATDQRFVAAHLEVCGDCARIARSMSSLRELTAIDLPGARRSSDRLGRLAERTARWGVARGLVALASAQILVVSIMDLVGSGSHEARHLAAFTLAYGLLLASVAHRPARARTALPVSALLGATLVITAVVDLLAGRIPLSGEALHLPEVVSVVAVGVLAGAFDRVIRSRREAAARRRARVAPVPHHRD